MTEIDALRERVMQLEDEVLWLGRLP